MDIISEARARAKVKEANEKIGKVVHNEFLFRLSQEKAEEFDRLIDEARDFCNQLGCSFELDPDVYGRYKLLKDNYDATKQDMRPWFFEHYSSSARGREQALFEFNQLVMGALRHWFTVGVLQPDEMLQEANSVLMDDENGFSRLDLYPDVQEELKKTESVVQQEENRRINWISEITSSMEFGNLDFPLGETHGFSRQKLDDVFPELGFSDEWIRFYETNPFDSCSYWINEAHNTCLFRFTLGEFDCRLWCFRLFSGDVQLLDDWILDLTGLLGTSQCAEARKDLQDSGTDYVFSTLLSDHHEGDLYSHWLSQLTLRFYGNPCHALYHVVRKETIKATSDSSVPTLVLSEGLLAESGTVSVNAGDRSMLDLSPVEFEMLCKQVVQQMGFEAETTKASGDGGVDVIAFNRQPLVAGKYVIQCKRYSGSVGEPTIRDLYGVVMSERANKGILMTTGTFTRQARAFAEDKPLELIDGDALRSLIPGSLLSSAGPTQSSGPCYADVSSDDLNELIRDLRGLYRNVESAFSQFDEMGLSGDWMTGGRYSRVHNLNLATILDYELIAYIDYILRDGTSISHDEVDYLSRLLGYTELDEDSIESVVSLYPEGGGNYLPVSYAVLHAACVNGVIEVENLYHDFFRLIGEGTSALFGRVGTDRLENYLSSLPNLDED